MHSVLIGAADQPTG